MRTQRQLRVGEAIRHALSEVIQRGNIMWPKHFAPPLITITEVQVSPDLRNCTAFVMPLGGQLMVETVAVLNKIAGHFRHELAHMVQLRYVPAIVFKSDTSFEYAEKIEKILHDPAVAKDLAGE